MSKHNIRFVSGNPAKNIYFGSSNTYIHQHGPGGKVTSSVLDDRGMPRDITGIPHFKKVENQFNIVGGNLGNMAIQNAGTTNFNQNVNTYESGSTHKKIDISDGQFVGSNIGGTARYHNKDSSISGLTGGSGASPVVWDYNVDSTLLKILKGGIEVETLVSALGGGFKLVDICKAVERTSSDGIPALSKSLTTCSPQDLGV